MKLSIIIVNWNTRELLSNCLRSIYLNPPQAKFEVLVVDNGSTDGSPDLVKKTFPQVDLICNSTNLGFSKANNQGIRASQGEYILLLNSDTEVASGALQNLLDFMERNPQAGAAAGQLLLKDGSPQPFIYGRDPRLSYLIVRILRMFFKRQYIHNWATQEVVETDWVTGAFMVVRKKAIDEVGLLDENMFMYFEDNDWCYRMREKGWKVYYYPQAQIKHLCGGSLEADNPQRKADYYKSLLYFYEKHYRLPARLALRVFLGLYRNLLARKIGNIIEKVG